MKYIYYIFLFSVLFSCQKEVKNNKNNIKPDLEARSQIINADEINKKIRSGEKIIYQHATIVGDINFLNSSEYYLLTPYLTKFKIKSSIIFYNCTFKGNITAEASYNDKYKVCDFRKNVSFMHCTFQDTVNFKSADFQDLVNFSNSEFQETVNFESCAFNYKKNYFNKTKFLKPAIFNLIHSKGDISFFEAVFEDNTNFQLSKFNEPVQFSSVKIKGKANFTNVKFFDDVFFNYSEFSNTFSLVNSVFRGRAEFIKSKFRANAEFNDCLFYGRTKYNNSEIYSVLSFKNTYFQLNKPAKTDFIFNKNADLSLIEN